PLTCHRMPENPIGSRPEMNGTLNPVTLEFLSMKNLKTVMDGLDQAVSAFIGLFDGKNVGKMVVKL
ncbi:MAG: hypothetical protein WCN98_08220, partial [Verrucomicrobiaceae bacterium]